MCNSGSGADPVIDVADENLLACINDELGQDPADEVTEAQAASIDSLNCAGEGVEVLGGIEHLTDLEYLYLGGNEVADVGPLAELTSLVTLDIGFNSIVDVGPLAELTSLVTLYVDFNEVADLSPLEDVYASAGDWRRTAFVDT